MVQSAIQQQVNAIVSSYDRHTPLDDTKQMIRDARDAVQTFLQRETRATSSEALAQALAADPDSLHQITKEHFGFKIEEQPRYGELDDFAWMHSQRYSTLDGVTLPERAEFFTSSGRRSRLDESEVRERMESGEFDLFDIALSNEYVLLRKDENFSVRDLENKFSTNNEHMPPQSLSRRIGSTKVVRSDPRAVIISHSQTNSARGHLQVVFFNEDGSPKETIAMQRAPGEEESTILRADLERPVKELTTEEIRAFGDSSNRYPIGQEDAPHYAYALAMTHFASGFSNEAEKYWFDEKQAQEVVDMLNILAQDPPENVDEPVLRETVADAKLIGGNINPVALMPEVFAAALQAEIDQGKFHSAALARGERAEQQAQAALAAGGETLEFSHVADQAARRARPSPNEIS